MGLLDNPMALAAVGGPSLNNNSLSRNLMQMRALRYMHEPVPRAPGRTGVNMNPLNSMGNTNGDYSQFTFDPGARAAAESALAPYGMHPLAPEQVNPNALFANKGFFGNHPGLTNRLEGAIFGGAATQGSETWGEGISNVLQGMIGGQQARHGMWEQQFAAPFQAAHNLEGLMDSQQKRALTEADIQWRRAEAQKAGQDPFPKFTGHMAVDDGSVWAFDQQGTPKQLMPPGTVSKQDKNPLGSGLDSQIIRGELGDPPTDPKQAKDYWTKAEKIRNRMAGSQAAARASGSDAGHEPKRDEDRAEKAGLSRQKFVSGKSGDMKWLFSKGLDPNDPQLGKKLSDYYDSEIAPYGPDADSPMPQGGGIPSNPYRK